MTQPRSVDCVPAVSIGLPVFNGGDHLKTVIDSILAQEFTDFELIVSDNASTDGTEALCREYAARDARVRYVRRDRNYGMLNNGRNTLELARGQYFVTVSHDDEWKPRFLSACVERFAANPRLVLVSPAIEFFKPDGTIIDVPYPPIRTVGMGMRDRIATIFHENNVGYNIFGVMRKDALLKVNTQVECFACDVVHLLQLMFLGEVDHVPEKLFRFCFVKKTAHQHAANISKELGDKHPTRLYTILTINLFRAIMNSPVSGSLKRVLICDALEIIAVKNQLWRQSILSENPGLVAFVEPNVHGALPSPECNLIAAFAALLLPYCYAGAPYDGAIDFSGVEGFDTVQEIDRVRPSPGHREFAGTLANLMKRGMLAQALAYHDAYRACQPSTGAIEELDTRIDAIHPSKRAAPDNCGSAGSACRPLRIVFHEGTGMSGGWDALLRQQYMRYLSEAGHEVTTVAGDALPESGVDIVHALGLASSPQLEQLLNRTLGSRIPLVITALMGDHRRYQVKAMRWRRIFEKYLELGQEPENFETVRRYAAMESLTVPQPSIVAARYADRVLASGPVEARLVSSFCPPARISIVPSGVSGVASGVPKTIFETAYGVTGFVLCIADLSMVNNQLMLLKSLESDDIPLVCIDGGSADDAEYAALCKRFRRTGKTLFISNPPGELLLSAYSAARVFCLPAWNDLPGLATLEAAYQGCAVAASRWGCVEDYLGDGCEYCDPDSPESVRDAVLRAYDEGPKPGLRERAASFSWAAAADTLEAVYRELANRDQNDAPSPTQDSIR